MQQLDGGITSPRGFQAAGVRAGVKMKGNDVALIYSTVPAKATAVFTTSVVKAAPVLWSQRIAARQGNVQAVVANSGNANACTGEAGMEHAIAMAETAAQGLGLAVNEVMVASTGVIGVPLPIDKVTEGIRRACERVAEDAVSGTTAAEAIMTTDTFFKQVATQVDIDGRTVTIGGIAKGSGMIHPNMATMLAFLTTDVHISQSLLERVMQETVTDSYNMISVDGDRSTNDMAVLLANGAAGNAEIAAVDANYLAFREALQFVNTHLAKEIVRDGEGATKRLEVTVTGAQSKDQARALVQSVINSNLVKTAFFGEDPNWGRILAAMGTAGVDFNPARVRIDFYSAGGSIRLMEESEPLRFEEAQAQSVLAERDISILVTLAEGSATATGWGCDLSYEYVRINGEYRT